MYVLMLVCFVGVATAAEPAARSPIAFPGSGPGVDAWPRQSPQEAGFDPAVTAARPSG